MKVSADYFDKDYFESGRKTTATDMLKGRIYDPVAAAIADLLICSFGVRRYLEFGCGRGAVVCALRERGVRALGFDISEYATHCSSPGVYRGDATKDWDMKRHDFGVVYSIEVLEHISAQHVPFVLAEARETLTPGGYLVCSIATDEDLRRVEKILEAHPERRDESHVNAHSRQWWNVMALKAGFYVDDVKRYQMEQCRVPMTCSPYHSRMDSAPSWSPLDDSPFQLFGMFRWSLFVWRKADDF